MTLFQKKGGVAVLRSHGNSHIQALKELYPELRFNVLSGFSKAQQNYWEDPATHRDFFDEMAKDLNIDPLIPENWYTITHNSIVKRKGGTSIIKYYGNSYISALIQVYPEVNFSRTNFNKAHHWTSPDNCRDFFNEFAKERNFDPLIPQNWYSIYRDDIISKKGGKSVLRYYKHSHVQALVSLYPEVCFDLSSFNSSIRKKKSQM